MSFGGSCSYSHAIRMSTNVGPLNIKCHKRNAVANETCSGHELCCTSSGQKNSSGEASLTLTLCSRIKGKDCWKFSPSTRGPVLKEFQGYPITLQVRDFVEVSYHTDTRDEKTEIK